MASVARTYARAFADVVFDAKLDALRSELQTEIRTNSTALRESVRADIASAKVWGFALYLAFAAAMLGTLARGFGWI